MSDLDLNTMNSPEADKKGKQLKGSGFDAKEAAKRLLENFISVQTVKSRLSNIYEIFPTAYYQKLILPPTRLARLQGIKHYVFNIAPLSCSNFKKALNLFNSFAFDCEGKPHLPDYIIKNHRKRVIKLALLIIKSNNKTPFFFAAHLQKHLDILKIWVLVEYVIYKELETAAAEMRSLIQIGKRKI